LKKILFVDDEPKILEGLERLLRSQRDQWSMVFAPSGEAALQELEKSPFDVIVTDMAMPGMDGAALLREVVQRFPATARIILSGHTDREGVLRAVPVTHQFLSKPCNPETLKEVVERACNVQSLLQDRRLREALGGLKDLPCQPRVYKELLQALADPHTSMEQVTAIMEQDVALCARILQLVNSSFFGLARHISDIHAAVRYLGIPMLKNLSLSMEVFSKLEVGFKIPGFSMEELQSHAAFTAEIARRISKEDGSFDDAFVAGMLHDVGKLILATLLPGHLIHALELAREKKCPLHVAESERNGFTHAQMGAYFLGLWGLPYPILEAVAFHHSPWSIPRRTLGLAAIVYIADQLAQETETVERATGRPPETIDPAFLESLGVLGRLPAWRAMVAEVRQGSPSLQD
jgi:HD-like signal output (HDOD) protein